MLLLALWLIVFGVVVAFGIIFPGGDELIAILGIGAGVLLIYENRGRFTRNVGTLLVSVWLIVNGVTLLIPELIFSQLAPILVLLVLAGGAFIMVEALARGLGDHLGAFLLGVFLIASNVLPLLQVTAPFLYTVAFVIGIAAGVLILLKR
jgi:hypothetical protein